MASCGANHMGVVTEAGDVWLWGDGSDGQLGYDTCGRATAWPSLGEGWGEKIALVACGGSHTAAISDTGRLWICGDAEQGQLGLGDTR
jgi:alpha-tubulin suppressor-like RCC1 family protein